MILSGEAVGSELTESASASEDPVCDSEQRPAVMGRTLSSMPLQYIKMTLAALWVMLSIVVGVVAHVTSAPGLVALVAFTVLPILAMVLLWNEPAQTLSESIREGRR